ncbi:hypothetical protein ILYODFUR_003745, partial [Ilyodon furcidens]
DLTEGLRHASRSEDNSMHYGPLNFGGYETVSNTNTAMSYYCLTTVSHPCVSLTLRLSYTSDGRHLLRQRPQGLRH